MGVRRSGWAFVQSPPRWDAWYLSLVHVERESCPVDNVGVRKVHFVVDHQWYAFHRHVVNYSRSPSVSLRVKAEVCLNGWGQRGSCRSVPGWRRNDNQSERGNGLVFRSLTSCLQDPRPVAEHTKIHHGRWAQTSDAATYPARTTLATSRQSYFTLKIQTQP